MTSKNKGARTAGLVGCLPSLVLFASAFTPTNLSWNLTASFLSLGFGIVGVIGLIGAYSKPKDEQKGDDK